MAIFMILHLIEKFKVKKILILSTFIVSTLCFANNGNFETEGASGIRLDSLYENLAQDRNYKDIRVYNDSNSVAYVSVSIVEVLNPGDNYEKVEEPKFGDGPVVNSKAIVIPVESSRSVRVFYPDDIKRENDRFYRIRFRPVLPTKKEGFSDEDINNVKEIYSSFKISFAWGVLLSVPKRDPNLSLSAKLDEKRQLILRNTGDSLVTVQSVVGCSMENDCKTLVNGIRVAKDKEKFISIDGFIDKNPHIKILNVYSNDVSMISINIK